MEGWSETPHCDNAARILENRLLGLERKKDWNMYQNVTFFARQLQNTKKEDSILN